ncbi:hypothetical protein KDN24_06790 [Bacillus sp. Bva_UNVM-123]|uniref:hypothetical protein n=1 Tax=Bacillus sp. Bva_UNVM-123 TaxID=2829798 RepID=UPI00391F76F9
MKLFGYELIIKKLPKVTAETVFRDIEYSFRDNYEDEYWEYYSVSKSMYKKIKQLAKANYDYHTRDSRHCFPSGDEISYYRFGIVKNKFFQRVLFRVINA